MTVGFTKIKWAGTEVILVTDNEHIREPILILDKHDIEKLNSEWEVKV